MDTGLVSHVTSRKDFFSSYTPCDFGTLSMGNEIVSRVVGICTCLETSVGTKLVLLELVHSNLCGPMKIETLDGALYFVTFIDD